MKRLNSTKILILTLALTVLCAACAFAFAEGDAVCALYPMNDETQTCYADFTKDITITLMDVPTGEWKLNLLKFGFEDDTMPYEKWWERIGERSDGDAAARAERRRTHRLVPQRERDGIGVAADHAFAG